MGLWLLHKYGELQCKQKIILMLMGTFILRLPLAIYHLIYWPKSFGPDLDPILMTLIEPYSDYDYYYKLFAQVFVSGLWTPYSGLVNHSWLSSYLYPPLFLYILSIPALISPELVFFPLFIADVGLPILIYLFLKEKSEKMAIWGYIVTCCCPFLIFYDGGLFLNTSLVLLALIVSLYFFYYEKYKTAVFTMALAFLIKQVILFFIPPLFCYAVLKSSNGSKKSYLKQFAILGVILIGTIGIGSLPWILLTPTNYISAVFMGQAPTLTPDLQPRLLTWPLHWYSFLIDLRVPAEIIYVVGFLTFTMLGLLITELFSIILLIRWHRRRVLDWVRILDIIIFIAILSHLFLPRGVYKYYFTLHIPLITLWIAFHYQASLETARGRKRWGGIVVGLSSLALIFPRQIYLLLIWLIFILIMWTDFKKHSTMVEN
ncbi:MAG: hypothetical protein ACFFCW_32015 [Candidatus Hodarchaeota archaeon]